MINDLPPPRYSPASISPPAVVLPPRHCCLAGDVEGGVDAGVASGVKASAGDDGGKTYYWSSRVGRSRHVCEPRIAAVSSLAGAGLLCIFGNDEHLEFDISLCARQPS
ncbi:hypothetical protein SCP_2000080 [Sparassis crispa]|uniref:Uncharacterized protein n=1 Tax=Sparassis crispa TaxID=139825 RepID=A0A401H765_9APHY|nr:hypothetical protein SCP_2000080 [Sparassis crispa]GBE90265.1 hypothetical protein SCP_2000080 [Sparassis crispa]